MPQVVHRPTIFNDDEGDPFGIFPDEQDDDPHDERDCLNDPKDHVEDLLVAGLRSVVGDVLQEFPHGFIVMVHCGVVMRIRGGAAPVLPPPKITKRRKI